MSSALALINAASNLLALLIVSVVLDPLATLGIVAALLLLGWAFTPLRHRVPSLSSDAVDKALHVSAEVTELASMGCEMQVFGVRGRFSERIRILIVQMRRD